MPSMSSGCNQFDINTVLKAKHTVPAAKKKTNSISAKIWADALLHMDWAWEGEGSVQAMLTNQAETQNGLC